MLDLVEVANVQPIVVELICHLEYPSWVGFEIVGYKETALEVGGVLTTHPFVNSSGAGSGLFREIDLCPVTLEAPSKKS